MRTSALLVVALAVLVGVGTLPPLLRHWSVRASELAERAAFARTDAADMARKYPSFMGSLVQQNAATVAEGTLAPVLVEAWNNNTLVCLVRAIANWVATNFLVRVLSPQTWMECAGLGALVLGLIVAVIGLAIGGNMYTNIAATRTFRKNAKMFIKQTGVAAA
jgi:hypothetical protein